MRVPGRSDHASNARERGSLREEPITKIMFLRAAPKYFGAALLLFGPCFGKVGLMSIRMRHTRSHTKNRRSHHALVGIKVVPTEEGNLKLPHRVDEATGMYRGKQIRAVKVKKVKGEAKVKGPRTEATHDHVHEKGEHKHENANQKKSKGFLGRIGNALPKARSGAGGGGA